ncbi:MAG: hypothetical protein OYG31_02260 [Candidatus Kaiserbacteria bacterium]|nr:hypothetical protein [Candidatus Kaiserbacteria bacterium]
MGFSFSDSERDSSVYQAEPMVSSFEDDLEQIKAATEYYQVVYPNLEENFDLLSHQAIARVAINHFVQDAGGERSLEDLDSSIRSFDNKNVDVLVRVTFHRDEYRQVEKAAQVLLERLVDEGINPTIQICPKW